MSTAILLVEDNTTFSKVIKEHITRQHGYQCETASSYTSARALAHQNFYKLIISDISLTDGSGLELLANIKLDSPDTAIILMSAISDRSHTEGAKSLGAVQFLSKPFKLTELDEAIRQALAPQNTERNHPSTAA